MVPALIGIDGEFSLENDIFEIIIKPHGHGDIHTLLYEWNSGQMGEDGEEMGGFLPGYKSPDI